MKVRDQVEEM